MHPIFTYHLTRWRLNRPVFVWLLIALLGFSSLLSAGHIHLDEASDSHHHEQSLNDDTDESDDHFCPICQLSDLNQGFLGGLSVSVVYEATTYHNPDYQSSPRGPPAGLFQPRAPPKSL